MQQTSENVEPSGVPPCNLEEEVLRFPAFGLICCKVPGDVNTPVKDEFKRYVKKRNEGYGYEGFDLSIDARFDPDSTLFYVKSARTGKILSSSRINIRSPGLIVPFEMGVITPFYDRLVERGQIDALEASLDEDGAQYVIDEEGVLCDVNSFAMTTAKGLPMMFAAMGRFICDLDAARAFCLLDRDNQRIVDMYTQVGFHLSEQYPEQVIFPTYGKTVDGVFAPTRWSIMEMDRPTLESNAELTASFEKP
ncbi:MAG: hypothetical protein ACE5DM_01075 [Candidatus Nanoarchaeia archaeon]